METTTTQKPTTSIAMPKTSPTTLIKPIGFNDQDLKAITAHIHQMLERYMDKQKQLEKYHHLKLRVM